MRHVTTVGRGRRVPAHYRPARQKRQRRAAGALFSRVDVARLWAAGAVGLDAVAGGALALYFADGRCVSAWRWGCCSTRRACSFPFRRLTSSFLVATFFNNFLPSNIGGDVIRIADTAPAAGSKTLAATVVLVDRGLGLLGLVLVAALGATLAARVRPAISVRSPGAAVGSASASPRCCGARALLMPEAFTRLLQPLRVLHRSGSTSGSRG